MTVTLSVNVRFVSFILELDVVVNLLLAKLQ